jgi:hypothetical protein
LVFCKNNLQHKKVQSLLIVLFWLSPTPLQRGGRMLQLISLFQNKVLQSTFASPAQDGEFMILAAFQVDKKQSYLTQQVLMPLYKN